MYRHGSGAGQHRNSAKLDKPPYAAGMPTGSSRDIEDLRDPRYYENAITSILERPLALEESQDMARQTWGMNTAPHQGARGADVAIPRTRSSHLARLSANAGVRSRHATW